MNLGQIRTRAKNRFLDPTGLIVTDAVWNDHIGAAYREFTGAARWPFLLASVNYTLAANTRKTAFLTTEQQAGVQSVFSVTHSRRLQPMPDLPWKQRLWLESRNTEPLYWELEGNDLYVLPAPTAITTLETTYYTNPTALSADTDIPVVPDRYHEALVSGALALAMRDDHNYDAANQYREEFTAIVRQAARELSVHLTEAPSLSVKGELMAAGESQ